jgi:ATP-binding cassette subfamily B protein
MDVIEYNNFIESVSWPLASADAALAALTQTCFASLKHSTELQPSPQHQEDLDTWLLQSTAAMSLESQQVSISYEQRHALLGKTAPAIIGIAMSEETKLLLLVKRTRRDFIVLDANLTTHKVAISDLVDFLVEPVVRPLKSRIETLLDDAQIHQRRREKAKEVMLQEQLKDYALHAIWLLRLPPSQSFWLQVKSKGLHLKLLGLTLTYTAQSLFFVGGWWLIGQAAFNGHVDLGWLWAWGLLLLSQVPLQLLTSWLQANITIDTGQLIKKRLLIGSLMMDPNRLKKLGIGQLLSRVFDAETIESVTLQGSFIALLALVELGVAIWIMLAGLAGGLHIALLGAFLIVLVVMCRHQFTLRYALTQSRLNMSHRLIEKMVGHRTRLAQQPQSAWHQQEDKELQHYVDSSKAMDASSARLTDMMPRVWLILAIIAFIPSMIANDAQSIAVAISLGGVIYAYQAMSKIVDGFTNLSTAAIAWQYMKSIFAQAQQASPIPIIPLHKQDDSLNTKSTLLNAYNLTFGYSTAQNPIIEQGNLSIHYGDNILLQGESGSGKSTFANLLTGIQQPDQGTILYRGYDQASIGLKAWRRAFVLAPQFHQNHVFSGSFAFNLLMGDQWPPTMEAMSKAEKLCHDLGLGSLLERMPGGIMQMVGETGWQLSHGERSRLFLARAILQNADLVILDETFASLDPNNIQMALNCVKKEAKSLIIIAHP